LLEFMVAAGILAIFAALLLNRLHYYQEMAEKTNMEVTVKALQSGLRFEMARALMAGQEIDYPRLARGNPMEWLEPKPSSYRGEFRRNAGELARGAWYFDTPNRELVYLPALDGHFVPDSEGLVRIRFRVELLAGKSSVDIVTVQLKAVEAYLWF
jgi:general secretion pathway protein G